MKKTLIILMAACCSMLVAQVGFSDLVIENFESYADQAALEASWVPRADLLSCTVYTSDPAVGAQSAEFIKGPNTQGWGGTTHDFAGGPYGIAGATGLGMWIKTLDWVNPGMYPFDTVGGGATTWPWPDGIDGGQPGDVWAWAEAPLGNFVTQTWMRGGQMVNWDVLLGMEYDPPFSTTSQLDDITIVGAGTSFPPVLPDMVIADFDGIPGWWYREYQWAVGPASGATPGQEDPQGEPFLGTYGLEFFIDGSQGWGQFQGNFQPVDVSEYAFVTFWAKSDVPGSTVSVVLIQGDWGAEDEFQSGPLTTTWEQQVIPMPAAPNSNLADMGVLKFWGSWNAVLHIDHVVVTATDPRILGPPFLMARTPSNGDIVNTDLSSIQVQFSVPVTGVDAADLLVDGVAATAVNSSDDTLFVFSGLTLPARTHAGANISVELLTGGIASPDGSYPGDTWSFEYYAPYEYDAPYVQTPPVLDGVLNAGEWTGLAIDTWEANALGGTPDDAADWSPATWSAMHDDTYLYISYQAIDDVIYGEDVAGWMNDNVEFTTDGPNVKSGTGIQVNINRRPDGFTPLWEVNNGDTEFGFSESATGYILEIRVLKSGHSLPASGVMGFDIATADNDGPGRDIHEYWNVSPDGNLDPWNVAADWGNMTLLSPPANPVIFTTDPVQGSSLLPTEVVPITVVFDQAVTSLNADALVISDSTAAVLATSDSVTSAGGDTWIFGFSTWTDPSINLVLFVDMAAGGESQAYPGFVFAGDSWTYNYAMVRPSAVGDWMLYE